MAYGYTGDIAQGDMPPNGLPTTGGAGQDWQNSPIYDPGGGGGGGGTFGAYAGAAEPTFHKVAAPDYLFTKFQAPTQEEALNSPGYQFRLGQGMDALQRSAAAKGLLRTGGTLKDIMNYGQGFASQEYQNVYDRALNAAKLRAEQEAGLNTNLGQDYRTRMAQENLRAMAEFNRPFEVWSKQGDWAHMGGGGGGYEEPMPVWNENGGGGSVGGY